MSIEEEYVPYTAVPFLAEVGGFMGIFIGLSVYDLIAKGVSLVEKMLRICGRGQKLH